MRHAMGGNLRDLHEEAFEYVRSWWRAWAEKDLSALERMVGPGYSERTATHGTRTYALDQLMEEASRSCEEVSIVSWELTDPVTKLYQRRVVCSYAFRLAGTRGGRPFSFTGRATDVLLLLDEAFSLLSHEGTLETSWTRPG